MNSWLFILLIYCTGSFSTWVSLIILANNIYRNNRLCKPFILFWFLTIPLLFCMIIFYCTKSILSDCLKEATK
jgi:hypothetical protein